MRTKFINARGDLSWSDFAHLEEATIGVLWTNTENVRRQKTALGTAEMFNPKGDGWQRQRQRAQIVAWFGEVPDFIITLAAPYAATCSDLAWVRLCFHELKHCGQAEDKHGNPRFRADGRPVFALRGHDVEVFLDEVRLFGLEALPAEVAELVALAGREPELPADTIAWACGTCRMRAV